MPRKGILFQEGAVKPRWKTLGPNFGYAQILLWASRDEIKYTISNNPSLPLTTIISLSA